MKLACGIVVFNDRDSLKRTLDSLGEMDNIYVIDGSFPAYSYPSDLSDDGTRELCSQYKAVELVDYPSTEVSKRNKYLELCKRDGVDFLLIIDSDEYVLDADWDAFRRNCEQLTNDSANIYGIRCYYNIKEHRDTSVYPRLWRKPSEMEYHQCHNVFRHIPTGNTFRSPSDSKEIPGIKLAWDDSLRNKEWLSKTYDYQVKLIEDETKKSKALRL